MAVIVCSSEGSVIPLLKKITKSCAFQIQEVLNVSDKEALRLGAATDTAASRGRFNDLWTSSQHAN